VEDLWTYKDESIGDIDLVGFSVEATNGGLGKVDEASYEVGACCIVVDTGRFFGKKAILPAGMIDRIDTEAETVYVNATKDEIKNAPEYEPIGLKDDEYKTRIGTYYVGTTTYKGTRV
jgi:hypothetical protein